MWRGERNAGGNIAATSAADGNELMAGGFGWLDVEDIAEALHEQHPDKIDPLRIRFTELRRLVEALPDFEPDPEHPVNEKILEHIQAGWIALRQGTRRTEDDEE